MLLHKSSGEAPMRRLTHHIPSRTGGNVSSLQHTSPARRPTWLSGGSELPLHAGTTMVDTVIRSGGMVAAQRCAVNDGSGEVR